MVGWLRSLLLCHGMRLINKLISSVEHKYLHDLFLHYARQSAVLLRQVVFVCEVQLS